MVNKKDNIIEVKELLDRYFRSQRKLWDKLDSFGNEECICKNDCEEIKLIDDNGDVVYRCLNCGGFIDE